MPYKYNPFTGTLDVVNPVIDSPFLFKGDINTASDFPTSSEVQNGWTYFIKTDVTDNDVSRTNTGQSFLAGSEIAWNGTNWTELGNNSVLSVNGETGVVVLDTDDINDTATNRYTNDTDINRLANTSGTNTGDQDLSHTGEVTGTTQALTLNKTAISNKTDTPIAAGDYIIYGDTSDSDNLKKCTVQGIIDLVPSYWDKVGDTLIYEEDTGVVEVQIKTYEDENAKLSFYRGDGAGGRTGDWDITAKSTYLEIDSDYGTYQNPFIKFFNNVTDGRTQIETPLRQTTGSVAFNYFRDDSDFQCRKNNAVETADWLNYDAGNDVLKLNTDIEEVRDFDMAGKFTNDVPYDLMSGEATGFSNVLTITEDLVDWAYLSPRLFENKIDLLADIGDGDFLSEALRNQVQWLGDSKDEYTNMTADVLVNGFYREAASNENNDYPYYAVNALKNAISKGSGGSVNTVDWTSDMRALTNYISYSLDVQSGDFMADWYGQLNNVYVKIEDNTTGSFTNRIRVSNNELQNYGDANEGYILYTKMTGTEPIDEAWNIYVDGTLGDNFLGGDNIKTFWGTGKEHSISSNGTDFIFNAQEVGSGHIVLNTPKTTTGDPTGVEGKIYWNTVDNVIKMYCDGAWRTLASW